MYVFLVLFLPLMYYPAVSNMDFYLPFYHAITCYHGIFLPVFAFSSKNYYLE